MKKFAIRVCPAVALCLLALPAMAQSCLGDLNADRTVTGTDLGILLGQWGQAGSGDLNGDEIVGGADIGLMLGAWGNCPVTVPSWATLIEPIPDLTVVTDNSMRAAIAASGLPWRVRDTSSQIEMLLVPAGIFTMGCTASNAYQCNSNEIPTHTVTLTQAFYMGRYEVTQAQWQAKMGSNPSWFQGANRPVEMVSWNTIQNFLNATGTRLPSEAEWEYACRAGTTTAFHNGSSDDNSVGAIAWYSANSLMVTHTVGSKAANALGLHDMSGNVWEWVNDWYSSTYYASSPATNPQGPPAATTRVVRGGAWGDSSAIRSSSRFNPGTPDGKGWQTGFRVARTP
jgi:formylglycine-generating enzyme required for sulfatase activity